MFSQDRPFPDLKFSDFMEKLLREIQAPGSSEEQLLHRMKQLEDLQRDRYNRMISPKSSAREKMLDQMELRLIYAFMNSCAKRLTTKKFISSAMDDYANYFNINRGLWKHFK